MARARQHDVDDVGQRHVAVVRSLVIAPAQVHAQLLRRDVARARGSSASTCSSAFLRNSREAQRARTGCAGPCRDRDSRSAARCRHSAIVSYSSRIASAIASRYASSLRVVLVAEEQRHDARRGRREKRLLRVSPWRTRACRWRRRLRAAGRIAHADRCVARRRLAPRAAWVAEHALREVGKVDEILVDERVAGRRRNRTGGP